LLYQSEILDQDIILGWGEENKDSTDELTQKFYKAVRNYFFWGRKIKNKK